MRASGRSGGAGTHILRAVALLAAVTIPVAIPPAEAKAQQGARIRYVDADLRDVVRSLGNMLGLNILISQEVPSTSVTYTTPGRVPAGQIGSVLEALLESYGLVLVNRGAVAEVMPADAAPATGPVHVGKELPTPRPLGLVTQVVPLTFLRPGEAIATLRELASPTARLRPAPRSNAILVTDRATNVARYLDLIRELDVEQEGTGGLRTYVYRLKHGTASELAMTLGQIYDVEVPRVGPSSRVEALRGRSLSGSMEAFRQRELQSLEQRRQLFDPSSVLSRQREGGQAAPDTAARRPPPPGETAGEASLVGRTSIVPHPSTNSLVIRTAPPNYPILEGTIQRLDVRPAQVLLEVTVAEITLDQSTEYGINWSIFTDLDGDDDITGRLGSQAFSDSALAGVQDLVVRLVTLGEVDARAVLRMLETTSDVNVVSTPHVTALNNEEARILVGSQVPFTSSTRTGFTEVVDQTVQYRNVGTELTVIPTINEDGYVTFRVLQEVSSLTEQTIDAALNAPVIRTREAETSALVQDGRTVVIGGLISRDQQVVETGVPVLKDIPILSFLFKNTQTRHQRTELAIFITPHVVTSDADARALVERERRRLRPERFPKPMRRELPSPDTVPPDGGER